MKLVEIDLFAAKISESPIEATEDMLARVLLGVRETWPQLALDRNLAGDDEVGRLAKRLSQQPLGVTITIDQGGVKKVDAEIASGTQRLQGDLVFRTEPDRAANPPGTKSNFADFQAGASQGAVVHSERSGWLQLPQFRLQHLTRTVLGKGIEHYDRLRVQLQRNVFLAELPQAILKAGRAGLAGNDENLDSLAKHLIWNADHRGFQQRITFQKTLLERQAAHPFTAAFHKIFGAIDQINQSLFVNRAHIAGVQPPAAKCRRRPLRI